MRRSTAVSSSGQHGPSTRPFRSSSAAHGRPGWRASPAPSRSPPHDLPLPLLPFLYMDFQLHQLCIHSSRMPPTGHLVFSRFHLPSFLSDPPRSHSCRLVVPSHCSASTRGSRLGLEDERSVVVNQIETRVPVVSLPYIEETKAGLRTTDGFVPRADGACGTTRTCVAFARCHWPAPAERGRVPQVGRRACRRLQPQTVIKQNTSPRPRRHREAA